MKQYYNLVQEGDTADLYIYGDITSWPWLESDVSSYNLSRQLAEIEASTIRVFINSYGGEVAEGLAIYNALRRHSAKVQTYADGFACSIASVVFMAGDERIMTPSSLLMIHHPWTYTAGNAEELRKDAEDLEVIGQAAINAYLERIQIDETELRQLLDDESWLDSARAFEMGFASQIIQEPKSAAASMGARKAVAQRLVHYATASPEPPPEPPTTQQQEGPKNVPQAETPRRAFFNFAKEE